MATKKYRIYKITGCVIDQQGNPLADLVVRAFDRDSKQSAEPLGKPATTDAEGKYEIEFNEQEYKGNAGEHGGPDVFIRVYAGDLLLGESPVACDARTAVKINLKVELTRPHPKEEARDVHGVVRDAIGDVLTKATVWAFDRDLRHAQLLGRDVADREGRYRIAYATNQFRRAEKQNADLAVEVTGADGNVLATSETLFNAPHSAEIDVTVPGDALSPPSLFERIERALAPLLEGTEPAELEEDEKHQDVGFLAGETGFEAAVLSRFGLAHRAVGKSDLPPEFWFTVINGDVFRYEEGMPLREQMANLIVIFPSLDDAAVRKALTRSFRDNEINRSFRDRIDRWLEAFEAYVARLAVSDTGGRQGTFLKAALDDAGVAGDKQVVFARLFHRHRAMTPELVQELEEDDRFDEKEVAELQASFKLAELTQTDFGVVKMIKDGFDVRRPEAIPALARKTEDEWVELVLSRQAVGTAVVPPMTPDLDSIGQHTEKAALRVQGQMLHRRMVEIHPTSAFAGGLSRALGNGGARGLRRADELNRFLKMHTEFEFLNTSIDTFLDKQVADDFRELAKDEEFRLELKAAQRVFKLAPSFEAADSMLAEGVHSARTVYRMGESEFVRRFADQPGFSREKARRAWNRAAGTHAAVLTLIGDLKALDPEAQPRVLTIGDTDAVSTFPNWKDLFKTGDLCDCEHCRSVLGPAAYFADLMMFLKDRRAKNPADTLKDLLLGRRPDLGYLELNCKNALTPLPYVDVVCEVLEHAIAGGENDIDLVGFNAMPGNVADAQTAVRNALEVAELELGVEFTISQVDPGDPDRWVVHSEAATYLLMKKGGPDFVARVLPNTKAGAAELRANPQYANAEAYLKLRQSRYPMGLPFNLFGEETRAVFGKINVQRWDLMRTFHGPAAPNNPSDTAIACEFFEISVDSAAPFDERRLILDSDATVGGQQTVWGEVGNAGWLTTIGNVEIFLQKTGLSYQELLELLDLEFVNPGATFTINHLDASCDLDKKQIDGLNAPGLDRVHRFLRLWRKLKDWKMWELDLVLRDSAIGGGVLNDAFLRQLFYFHRLKDRLGKKATVERVAALFSSLNTRTLFTELHEPRADALYQELFLNRRLTHPLDAAFQIDAGTGDVPPGESITGHLPVVLAALRLRESDLLSLMAMTKASDGTAYVTDTLDVNHLSFLFRHAWLAGTLKMKVEEWTTLIRLRQQDVFNFSNPQAAWDFVEMFDHLYGAKIGVDELSWVLAADRTAKAATSEDDAARFLSTLRTDLQNLAAEFDPGRYRFLVEAPPTDAGALESLLTTLLGQLNLDETAVDAFLATLRDDLSQAVDVAGMPAGYEFPQAIKDSIPIRFDEAAGKLRYTGLMTSIQRTTLLTDASLAVVTGIASYQDALNELFEAPRLGIKFFDPVFTAPLEELPTAVSFSALADRSLQLKISYDAEQRLLRFRGIMSSAEETALESLSADADYLNAVNSLATQPALIAPPDDRIWLTEVDLDFPLRDLDDPTQDNLGSNLAVSITKALAYLKATLSEGLVVQQSASRLGTTDAVTRSLLTDYALLPDGLLKHLTGTFSTTSGVVDYATLKATFDGWFWAERAAKLLLAMQIEFEDLERIRELAGPAQLMALDSLPLDSAAATASFEQYLRTSRLLRLHNRYANSEPDLLTILERLNDGDYANAGAFAADVERMNEDWPATDVEAFVGAMDLAYPADYLFAESWERLVRAFSFMDSLNAGADTTRDFAAPSMMQTHARTLRELLRSKLGAETWLTVSGEIQDVLRERKRAALAAYLLAQPQPVDAPGEKWENTNDLYAYYLLDIEMSSCQLTSRFVQGSGSIQLFVQRCFMGLEPEVTVKADGDDGDSAWHWWKWMRKYRVWEANRKVFLWPENWIEPELKKDRSSFFKEFENELLQNEINQETVEKAFISYLEKLEDVGQLEVAGFFHEDDGDNAILHVFGRTTGSEPRIYYYRRFDYRQWTPWEKVDLDIKSDYLIPAVINRRLFLFWPVFMEVPDEDGNNTTKVPKADTENEQNMDVQKSRKRLQLQMAMSDYRNGKWTPRRLSEDHHDSNAFEVEIVRKRYLFVPVDRTEIDGRFGIKYSGHSVDAKGNSQAFLNGAFEISGCRGVPEHASSFPGYFQPVWEPEYDATGSVTTFQRWVELAFRHDSPENDFTLENNFASGSKQSRMTAVLMRTPWLFRMMAAWHPSFFDRLFLDGQLAFAGQVHSAVGERSAPIGSWLPYFYNDKKRTFFALPMLATGRRDERILHYYPDIKREVKKWLDAFEGMIRDAVEAFDFSAWTAQQREQVEQFIHVNFPDHTPPPYTLDQLIELIVRLYMRFVHLYVAAFVLMATRMQKHHFKIDYHPFVCVFSEMVFNPAKGIPALMSRQTQLVDSGFRFDRSYEPTAAVLEWGTTDFYPKEDVDFTPDGAYSPYNWELFYHAPLLIANALSQNQRFEDAREWYHFIFNPVGVESPVAGGSPMSKYWITRPFFETTGPDYVKQRIENIMRMLAGDTSLPGYSNQIQKDIEGQVRDWRTNPFEPHRIANYRTVAYQKTVFMKYLDNLIAWADYLFRQDSMESINEATQLYVLAAELLGERPKKVPPQTRPADQSFNELESEFDAFSNALVEVENLIPVQPGDGGYDGDAPPLPMLYFCIPHNEKLLGYWDVVADRLYKIRHCMNIEGVVRQLSLFEPPIDPGALVKAVAGGMDIGSALADLNAPLPIYRFNVLLRKANEVCNDVKALGGALLSALEKKDGEELTLLRQSHEIKVLESVTAVREIQIEEAKYNLDGIKKSQDLAKIRKQFYDSREFMNAGETAAMVLSGISLGVHTAGAVLDILGGVLAAIPNFDVGASGFGGSPVVKVKTGGMSFSKAVELAARALYQTSTILDKSASIANTVAGYQRRMDDWQLQAQLAEKEISQLDEQIAAAEQRIALAEKELENHKKQIENAKEIDIFMRSKYTNKELYQWQIGQISGVFFESYKLAYDLAKKTEQCFRFELGVQDSSYIKFGYWDSLKKGLQSGEKLQHDLHRLETAYLERNRREFELTKHISLALLDPIALITLQETGHCFFQLPEELFDLDYAGHYFRRIKSVSITLPCVTGPYTTVACTLRLLKNSIRVDTADGDNGYPRNVDDEGLPAEDVRFIESNVPAKAIATSNAQNDSGVFQLNFEDPRYLPFEGAGAVSSWSLELFHDARQNNPEPNNPDFGKPLRQFDYSSISDAVIHVRYTARENAGPFKNGAVTHLRDHFNAADATPSVRMFNLAQEFPTQWHRFLHPTDPADGNVFDLKMITALFRTLDSGKALKINTITLMSRCEDAGDYTVALSPPLPVPDPPDGSNELPLTSLSSLAGLHLGIKDVSASNVEVTPDNPPVTWRLQMTRPGGGNLQPVEGSNRMEVENLILVLGFTWS